MFQTSLEHHLLHRAVSTPGAVVGELHHSRGPSAGCRRGLLRR